MELTRKLVAIMFTDIEGYTTLMQESEAKAVEVRTKHRAVFHQVTHDFQGEIIQYFGDGTLSIFQSAVQAVKCGAELQRQFRTEPAIPVRIGLHIGDIVISDEDVYGNAVNLASRIESLSVSGSVFLSQKVADELRNQEDIELALMGSFHFKNDATPRVVYAVADPELVVPEPESLEGKGKLASTKEKKQEEEKTIVHQEISKPKSLSSKQKFAVGFVLLGLLLGSWGLFQWYNHQKKVKWVQEEAIPEIETLIEKLSFGAIQTGSGPEAWEAFEIAKQVSQILPNDRALKSLMPRFSQKVNITSEPIGAKVYARPVTWKDTSWTYLGETPLKDKLMPTGNLYIKLEKEEHGIVEDLIWNLDYFDRRWTYKLLPKEEIPEGMMFATPNVDTMLWNWLNFDDNLFSDPFFVDKYEVTNEAYKAFVDAGGYKDTTFWKHAFYLDNSQILWEEAMALFVDQTGRQGPATWIGGTYEEGKGSYPVGGVSWYEAAAYAEFANKRLPSRYHHMLYGANWAINEIILKSNFDGQGPQPGVNSQNITAFGVRDVKGNVREWVANSTSTGDKFILGGGWGDEKYTANQNDIYPPMSRSILNGFRCIKVPIHTKIDSSLFSPIVYNITDFNQSEPVSDEVFEVFRDLYAYKKFNFEEKVLYQEEEPYWKKQKISIKAAYNNEDLTIYIFLPLNTEGPFQTVMYFPGANAWWETNSEQSLQIKQIDYLVKSGRAVIYPVYKSTYERRPKIAKGQNGKMYHRDLFIMDTKDISRVVDYLETREDLSTDKLAYYGVSSGAIYNGSLALAIENRFDVGILMFGGFSGWRQLPEVESINYLPRITLPVLMMNGKYDHIVPYTMGQTPYFNLLGTPPEDKYHLVYEDGHFIPRTEMIKETLDFLDKYLGEVE